MKLTKTMLKRLIKEELKKVLKEANTGYKRDDTQGRAGLDGFGDDPDDDEEDQNWNFKDDDTQGKAALKEEDGEQDHEMFAKDDELKELGSYISDLNRVAGLVTKRMKEMAGREDVGGQLSATTTYAVRTANAAAEVSRRFNIALDEMLKTY